jgi:hypothetical protein
VLKNASGNLRLGADVTLDSPYDSARLLYTGQRWVKLDSADVAVPNSDLSFLYRYFTDTGIIGGYYDVMVPYATLAGSYLYACYRFLAQTATGVRHLMAIYDGVPTLTKWHSDGSVTKTGSWADSTVTDIPNGGTVARSNTAGDTIAASVSGHTLFLRSYLNNGNGGFGLVAIDGDYTAANRLPAVVSGDFKAITNVVDNGAGLCRVTAASHGFGNNAQIIIEDVAGATGVNGTHVITTIDSNTFDLQGSTFGGTYTSGGTAGFFAQADLGKRWIDYQGSAPFTDEWDPLADGLSDGAHTITAQVKGTNRGNGASGGRVYVIGFAAASAGYLPNDGAGYGMAIWREAHNFRQTGNSAVVAAPEIDPVDGSNPSGYGSKLYLGDIHGNETQSAITYKVDGEAVSLSAGSYASGFRIEIARVGQVTHPAIGGAAVANRTTTFIGTISDVGTLRVLETWAWVYAAKSYTSYFGMIPAGRQNRNLGGVLNDQFDRALVGATEISDLGDNDDTNKGQLQAATIEFFHTTLHNLRWRAKIDVQKNVNSWLKGSPLFAFMADRSDGLDKGYFARSVVGTNVEDIAISDVFEVDTYYKLWRE